MNNTITLPTMISVKQASAQFGLTPYFLRSLCHDGKIRYIKVSKNRWLLNAESIADYCNGIPAESPPARHRAGRSPCHPLIERKFNMIHLYGKFYLTADGNSYTVGIPSAVSDRCRASGRTAPVMREARYYPTLENAVQGAANSALRDCIASDEVQSLHDAVEALRTISKEIRAAVSVLDTNTAGK